MDVVQLAAETRNSLTGALTVVGTLAFVAACFAVVEVVDRRSAPAREHGAATGNGTRSDAGAEVGLDGPAVDVFEDARPFGFGAAHAPVSRNRSLVVSLAGVAGALILGAALIPLRATVGQAGVALSLVLVVIAAAALGGRLAAAITSAGAALAFNFLHTEPYFTFHIDHSPDVITSVLMIVVGVAVGEVCQRNLGDRRATAERSIDERSIR